MDGWVVVVDGKGKIEILTILIPRCQPKIFRELDGENSKEQKKNKSSFLLRFLGD
jgi:hypothetical protein